MPITLGCPTCGKRFRARDESAGKRVKCPFCQAAVSVPSGEDSQHSPEPSDIKTSSQNQSQTFQPPVVPKSPPPTAKEPAFFDIANKPRPAPVHGGGAVPSATSDDWGTVSPSGTPSALRDEPSPALAFLPSSPAPRAEKSAPKSPTRKLPTPAANMTAAPAPPLGGWKKTRGGLGWVRFALFLFSLMAFVPLGKKIYERSVAELPKGPGWLVIEGQINSPEPDTIKIDKREEIDALAYGVPFILGGLSLILGRITCGAAPRTSGTKGLFAMSGLAALVVFAAILTIPVCERTGFRELYKYCWFAIVALGAMGEFWFLMALAGCAGTLRRPKSIRTIGFCSLVLFAAVMMEKEGWPAYLKHGIDINGTEYRRIPNPDADWLFYEDVVKLIGWLFVIGTYWRAVGGVKLAIREFVEKTESERVG